MTTETPTSERPALSADEELRLSEIAAYLAQASWLVIRRLCERLAEEERPFADLVEAVKDVAGRRDGSSQLADSVGGAGSDDEVPASQLLAELERTGLSDPERRGLIVALEVLPVRDADRAPLAGVLGSFIGERRDSEDSADLVAVGSAIRKLVAILPPEELPSVAGFLAAGHRAAVPLDVELEVAKTIVRRLSSSPIEPSDRWSPLADRFAEIATSYLNDRLLPREKYAATALNAVLALCLLGSDRVDEVVERLGHVRLSWFKQLLQRRAKRVRDQVASAPGADGRAALTSLDQLVAVAGTANDPDHARVSVG